LHADIEQAGNASAMNWETGRLDFQNSKNLEFKIQNSKKRIESSHQTQLG
jgi:hypothetical protein